jgi:AcrR family transcriptional regulator
VPLDEIARRAGVGAGTVYRHFPTKEALFEAVILERLAQMVRYARSLASVEDPGGAFFDFLHRMLTGAGSSKALADAMAGFDLSAPGLIASSKQELNEAAAELLRRAQATGAVRDDVGLTDVMTLLTGATMALQQHPGETALRETVFAVLRDGLRPRG